MAEWVFIFCFPLRKTITERCKQETAHLHFSAEEEMVGLSSEWEHWSCSPEASYWIRVDLESRFSQRGSDPPENLWMVSMKHTLIQSQPSELWPEDKRRGIFETTGGPGNRSRPPIGAASRCFLFIFTACTQLHLRLLQLIVAGPVALWPSEDGRDWRYSEEAMPVETLPTWTREPLQAPSISKAARFTLTRSPPVPFLSGQVLQQVPRNPTSHFLPPLPADEGPLHEMTLRQSQYSTDSGI